MSSKINNLALHSIEPYNDTYKLVLSFDNIPAYAYIGAYKIYKSYSLHDKGTFSSIIAEKSSIYTTGAEIAYYEEGKTFLNYYVTSSDLGRVLYLHISPISRTWLEFVSSSIITIAIPPSQVQSLTAYYDNYSVTIDWEKPSIANNANLDISGYYIKRANSAHLNNVTLNDQGNLVHSSFTKGNRVFVVDFVHKSYWYGFCNTAGEFILDDATKFSYVYEDSVDVDVSLYNLHTYVEVSFEIIGISPPDVFTYKDISTEKNSLYFYSVSGITNGLEGNASYYPLFTHDIKKISPYLRSCGTSENSYISSSYWRKLKDVLIDQNYYNKQAFDIPKIKGMYALTGFLGLANCKVDIFINDTYTTTSISDHYGGFSFSAHLPGKSCKLSMQARDQGNVGFSMKSTPQIIRMVGIYSFFSALAKEYTDIWEEILLQLSDFSYTNSRPQLLESKLQPFVGITQHITESDENFAKIITQAYLAYDYAGYEESLRMILAAMQDTISELDHYDIFFRDRPMDTLKTGFTYVINDQDMGLLRKNYIYAVTATNIYEEETAPAIIRADNRSWPTHLTSSGIVTDTEYNGYNVLEWDHSIGSSQTNRILIATTSLSRGELGVFYSQQLITRGGTLPFTFSINSGVLSNGLSLNSSTGEISGVVNALGNMLFTVRCTDFVGDYFDRVLFLEIPSVLSANSLQTDLIYLEVPMAAALVNYIANSLTLELPQVTVPFSSFTAHITSVDCITGEIQLGAPHIVSYSNGAAINLDVEPIYLGQPGLVNISTLISMSLTLEQVEISTPILVNVSHLISQNLDLGDIILNIPTFTFNYHIDGESAASLDTTTYDEEGATSVPTFTLDGGHA